MKKNFKRKIMTLSISSMLLIGSSLTAMAAPSIGNLSSDGYVWGDGIRLRAEPWTGGTVLELMYNNEQVKYDPDYFDPNYDPDFTYVQRNQTGKTGYCDRHYVKDVMNN